MQDVTLANFLMRVSRGFHVTRTLLESCVSEKHNIQGVIPFFKDFFGLSGCFWATWGSLGRHGALGGGLMWHMQGWRNVLCNLMFSHVFIDIFRPGRGFSLENIAFQFIVF